MRLVVTCKICLSIFDTDRRFTKGQKDEEFENFC